MAHLTAAARSARETRAIWTGVSVAAATCLPSEELDRAPKSRRWTISTTRQTRPSATATCKHCLSHTPAVNHWRLNNVFAVSFCFHLADMYADECALRNPKNQYVLGTAPAGCVQPGKTGRGNKFGLGVPLSVAPWWSGQGAALQRRSSLLLHPPQPVGTAPQGTCSTPALVKFYNIMLHRFNYYQTYIVQVEGDGLGPRSRKPQLLAGVLTHLVPGIWSSICTLSTEKRRLLQFPMGPSPAAYCTFTPIIAAATSSSGLWSTRLTCKSHFETLTWHTNAVLSS